MDKYNYLPPSRLHCEGHEVLEYMRTGQYHRAWQILKYISAGSRKKDLVELKAILLVLTGAPSAKSFLQSAVCFSPLSSNLRRLAVLCAIESGDATDADLHLNFIRRHALEVETDFIVLHAA